jgi:hypothetical protein
MRKPIGDKLLGMTKQQFQTKLRGTFRSAKNTKASPLLYAEMKVLSSKVKSIYRQHVGFVPGNVRFHCEAAEATLAPNTKARLRHIKAMVGVAGGVGGMATVITGLAGIFGWAGGVLTTIKVFFVGAALGGPIALIAAGIAVATIAGYFALTSDEYERADQALKTLKRGALHAADELSWPIGQRRRPGYTKGRAPTRRLRASKLNFINSSTKNN